MATINQINEFSLFAKQLSEKEGQELPLEVIFDRWHQEVFRDQDLLAIQASVRDYKNGERGRAAGEVLAEFRVERTMGKTS